MNQAVLSKIRYLQEKHNNATLRAAELYDVGGSGFYRWLAEADKVEAALKAYADVVPEMKIMEKRKKVPNRIGKKPLYYQIYVVKFGKRLDGKS